MQDPLRRVDETVEDAKRPDRLHLLVQVDNLVVSRVMDLEAADEQPADEADQGDDGVLEVWR